MSFWEIVILICIAGCVFSGDDDKIETLQGQNDSLRIVIEQKDSNYNKRFNELKLELEEEKEDNLNVKY